jgi:hypothetical protein
LGCVVQFCAYAVINCIPDELSKKYATNDGNVEPEAILLLLQDFCMSLLFSLSLLSFYPISAAHSPTAQNMTSWDIPLPEVHKFVNGILQMVTHSVIALNYDLEMCAKNKLTSVAAETGPLPPTDAAPVRDISPFSRPLTLLSPLPYDV